MIKLINVCKKYGKRELLKNVNLEIISPGIYSFIGDNGVGKTTLFNLINKNIKPTSGKVINTSKNSAFVFQSINLIKHLTIKEHFIIYKLDYKILKKFKLYSKLNNYPSELSFGQKQRIAIILHLYSSSLILLDEPTSHLDKENTSFIMKVIKKMSKDKIILLISHDLTLINEYSDYIYKIEKGEVSLLKESKLNEKEINNKRKRMNFKGYSIKSIRFYKKINLLFSLIFLSLSFMVLLANTLKYQFDYLLSECKTYSLDYNKFYLKECESSVKDKVIVKKCFNIKEEKVNLLNSLGYKVGYNYDLLMNDLYNSNKFNIISKKDYELIEGTYPLVYNEVIVSDSKYEIGSLIDLKSLKLIEMDKVDIYKNDLTLKVVGIAKEDFFIKNEMFYLDYDLVNEYLKREKLLNNNASLYSYFEKISIDNYKYVLYFNDINTKVLKDNNIEYLSSYDYYNDIEQVSDQVYECLNYLNISLTIFSIYYAIKLIRKKVNYKEDEIIFLKASGLKKRRIINLINKEQEILIIIFYSLSVILNMIISNIIFNSYFLNINYLFIIFILMIFINKLITKIILTRRSSI